DMWADVRDGRQAADVGPDVVAGDDVPPGAAAGEDDGRVEVPADHVPIRGRRPAHGVPGRPAVDQHPGAVPVGVGAGRVGADVVSCDDDPGRAGSGDVNRVVAGRDGKVREMVEDEPANGAAGTPVILYAARIGTSSKRWNLWTNKVAASCLGSVAILLRQSSMAAWNCSKESNQVEFKDCLRTNRHRRSMRLRFGE